MLKVYEIEVLKVQHPEGSPQSGQALGRRNVHRPTPIGRASTPNYEFRDRYCPVDDDGTKG